MANMSVEEIIKQVVDACRACKVEHLSLFGSYARGTATKYSDIDFVVYGVPDMEELLDRIDEIPTLMKIDLFEYDICENSFLREDMDAYAEKIY